MLYIKMMSQEDMHDTYAGKNFTLITVGEKDRIQFGEWGAMYQSPYDSFNYDGNTNVMIIIRENSTEQEVYRILGNVYIMNEHGKTISTRIARTNTQE